MSAFGSAKRKDIRFKRSFFRFTALTFFCLFLALLTQFFLRQVGLKQQITERLSKDLPYRVDVHEPSFQFRQGWWPIIGIHLARVEAVDKRCAEKVALLQGVSLPFQWKSLFSGAPRFGTVGVDFLDVSHRPCTDATETVTKAEPVSQKKKKRSDKKTEMKKTSGRHAYEALDIHLDNLSKMNWAQSLRGLDIKRLQALYKREKKDPIIRLEGRASLRADKILQFNLDLSQLKVGDERVPISKGELKAELSSHALLLDLEAHVREGLFTLNLHWPTDSEQEVALKGAVQKLPLSYLSSFYLKDNQLSYLWLNCQSELKSSKDKILETPFLIRSCLTDGPYGLARFDNIEYTLSGGLEAIDIEIDKMDLDQILRNKREAYLSGVLAKYGVLTQKVQYRQGVVETEGFLEDTEVVFSRRNRRELQKIKKISYVAKGQKDSWQARLLSLDLEGGEFVGDLKVQKKSENEKIDGQLSVHKLVFANKIYDLLLRSEVAVLTLYGQFQINGDKVSSWSALGATPELRSQDYRLENLKVKASGQQGGTSEISLNVSRGMLKGASELVSWLEPTTLDSSWIQDSIGFQELSLRLNLSEDKLIQWQRGYVRLAGGWQLSSEGERSKERISQAWLQWDRPDGRFLRWNFQGPLFDGVWYPQTQWVRDWLASNQSFLKRNKQISFEAEGS